MTHLRKLRKLILLLIFLVSLGASAQQAILKFDFDRESLAVKHLPAEIILDSSNNIPRATDSIMTLAQKRGYLNPVALPVTTINDSVFLRKILLGNRVSTLKIRPSDDMGEIVWGTLSRKRELNIPIEKTDSLLTDLNKTIANDGYTFNKVRLINFQAVGHDTLVARLVIDYGKRRTINRVVIKGYKKFPVQAIKGTYNNRTSLGAATLDKISAAIEKLSFVEEVRPAEVLFKQDSTVLYMYLKKKPVNSAEGLLGFNNTVNDKLELNGYLDLALINNLNQAETLTLNYRNENEDQTSLDIRLTVPYILSTNYGVDGSLNIKRRDSTYQNTSYNIGTTYKPDWLSSIGLSYRRVESTALDNTAIVVEDFTSDGIVITSSYIKRIPADRLMPEDLAVILEAGLDRRSLPATSINRQIIQLNAGKLWRLDSNNLVYTRLNGAYINDEELQFSELFQLGGDRIHTGIQPEWDRCICIYYPRYRVSLPFCREYLCLQHRRCGYFQAI